MKKIPSINDLTAADDKADHIEQLPVLPGTEQPRSLGDLMREAEADRDAEVEQGGKDQPRIGAAPPVVVQKKRRAKRPNRAQTRRFARERALQALYQWELSAGQSSTIRQEFIDTQDMSRVDVDYFMTLFNGVSHNLEKLDSDLQGCLDRPIDGLDPIERTVLHIAAFELSEQLDIPARVIINEGIEITKRFGADKGHRYVNGVLDKLAVSMRAQEMRRK